MIYSKSFGNFIVVSSTSTTKLAPVCILILIVWPGVMFSDVKCTLPEPDIIKKLPVLQSKLAVFVVIVMLSTLPLTEPVIICAPSKMFEPVIA